jgi:hypothetical protein
MHTDREGATHRVRAAAKSPQPSFIKCLVQSFKSKVQGLRQKKHISFPQCSRCPLWLKCFVFWLCRHVVPLQKKSVFICVDLWREVSLSPLFFPLRPPRSNCLLGHGPPCPYGKNLCPSVCIRGKITSFSLCVLCAFAVQFFQFLSASICVYLRQKNNLFLCGGDLRG